MKMRIKVFLLVVIATFGMGVSPASAVASPCVTGTIASYEALGSTGCEIGNLLFKSFEFNVSNGGAPVGSGPVSPSGGLSDTQATLTPLIDSKGIGFIFTPTTPWSASPTGHTDVELLYIAEVVNGVLMNDLYQEITGSAAGTSQAKLSDNFCPGGTSLPPAEDPFCPGGFRQSFVTITGTSSSTTLSADPTFSPVSSIAVLKDIEISANVDQDSGFATVTSAKNQISEVGSVPEPSTFLLLGSGLAGLAVWRKKESV